MLSEQGKHEEAEQMYREGMEVMEEGAGQGASIHVNKHAQPRQPAERSTRIQGSIRNPNSGCAGDFENIWVEASDQPHSYVYPAQHMGVAGHRGRRSARSEDVTLRKSRKQNSPTARAIIRPRRDSKSWQPNLK